jgi:hypothetical protein
MVAVAESSKVALATTIYVAFLVKDKRETVSSTHLDRRVCYGEPLHYDERYITFFGVEIVVDGSQLPVFRTPCCINISV